MAEALALMEMPLMLAYLPFLTVTRHAPDLNIVTGSVTEVDSL